MALAGHCCCYLLLHVLVIFLMSVHPCSSFNPETEQRVQKICRQTEDYGLCYTTFAQNIKSQSADFHLLTQVVLDQGTKFATNAHTFVLEVIFASHDRATVDALIVCEGVYEFDKRTFQQAAAYFNRGDYDGMLKQGINVSPKGCQISPDSPPKARSILNDINRRMRVLIAMATVTGHELLGH